ncbi:hypothetical protein HMN09_00121400 [Mycena chlorophos]|uniref:Osmotin thaumatin-like protein n=1 Tax=Mycena chlorophos TaxID=658473 RepID=A0A8H6TQJ3_MYCCL|nr:hypothetical protein HMN09_00121400 [Mycena chlorophos]
MLRSAIFALALVASTNAYTYTFDNKCSYTVWPAIGKAPNGVPDPSVAFGAQLGAGKSQSFTIGNTEIGIRAWGRTGCNSAGANCATGNCNGGLVCTDGGITSDVLLAELGYGDYGQYGGERTSWDLSLVSASLNINTELASSDGQSVTCVTGNCAPPNAFLNEGDSSAVHNSAAGANFVHTFCP